MRLVKATFVHNARLLGGGTTEVHYTPESPLQLLLGNNGSGKTTLLYALAPFPASPGDYVKGKGFEEKVYEKEGTFYTIRSDFRKGQTHSLQINDDEPIIGNATVIRTRLIELLDYTPETHNIAMGLILFTDLPAQKRREWLTKLSDVDVTYGLRIHKELATRVRNLQGALKLAEVKLTEELSTRLSAAVVEERKLELSTLTKKIHELLSAKNPTTPEYSLLVRDVKRHNETIQRLNRELQSVPRLYTEGRHHDTVIAELKSQLRHCEYVLGEQRREFERLDSLLTPFSHADERPLELLEKELKQLEVELETFSPSGFFADLTSLQEYALVKAELFKAQQSLDELYLRLPQNPNKTTYNNARVQQARETAQALQSEINRLTALEQQLRLQLRHIQNHSTVECPECKHVFIPGVAPTEQAVLEQQLTTTLTELERLQLQHERVTTYLTEYATYRDLYVEVLSTRRQHPKLARVFHDIDPDDIQLAESPKSLVGKLSLYLRTLDQDEYVFRTSQNHAILTETIHAKRSVGQGGLETLKRRMVELEHEHTSSKVLLERLTQELRAAEDEYRVYSHALRLQKELQGTLTELKQCMSHLSDAAYNEALSHDVDRLQSLVTEIRQELARSDAKDSVVHHLEASIAQYQSDLEAGQCLLKQLSPTEGIIAEQLLGYLGVFVNSLNQIIHQIWTVPLKLSLPSVNDTELDYLFPMVSSQLDHIVPDIAYGSRGQREVINFAFMSIALGGKNVPWFLDEVGHSFHQTHRDRLFAYIRTLLELKRIPQVFLVSHFASSHGALTNAEVNVLDTSGALVKPGENLNFKIV